MTETPDLPRGEWSDPVIPREPDKMPQELPRGADIPADLDPLAEGVLMRHQAQWLEDDSDLKVCAKGRRTGITFAEALDDTLIAAATRAAGGQNVFYIGDTKDKGREFIGYVAHFAKTVAKQVAEIEESFFTDQKADGSTRQIASYVIRFDSGFRVEALSSRPENIRGLQGVVVIDEAAFHKDVREVLDAVNALLIWGGKIRVISSHNGNLSPFNELIREARAGKIPFSVHDIPFDEAVKNGLYRRVCLIKGTEWTEEGERAWEKQIRDSYGVRKAKMRQELDAIPADAEVPRSRVSRSRPAWPKASLSSGGLATTTSRMRPTMSAPARRGLLPPRTFADPRRPRSAPGALFRRGLCAQGRCDGHHGL